MFNFTAWLCCPAFLILINLLGCSTTRTNPLLSQLPDAGLTTKEYKKIHDQTLALWEKRANRESLLAFIDEQLKLARSATAKPGEMVRLARAYYLLADSHSFDSSSQLDFLSKGANWAEKALTFNPAFKQKVIQEKLPSELAIESLQKKDSTALFWLAQNLGRWSELSGLNSQLKYRDRVKHMMDRVAELNSHYFHGGVYLYYGQYYATLPGVEASNLKLSEKNFKRALALAPDNYKTHVAYAETLAVKKEDVDSFKYHLNWVIKGTAANNTEDLIPENSLEQEKAKKLLARIGELF